MVQSDRRRFIAMSLAATGTAVVAEAAGAGESAATASASARPTYLVIYRRGTKWIDGTPMAQQPGMRDHFAYYVDLFRKGHLRAGGGFIDESGGAAIFEADDDAAAAAIIAADPAVVGEVFAPELKQWRQNPWADISKARAARGK